MMDDGYIYKMKRLYSDRYICRESGGGLQGSRYPHSAGDAVGAGSADSRESGFTLIELMIATMVFMIVVAISVVTMGTFLENGIRTERSMTATTEANMVSMTFGRVIRSAVPPPAITWSNPPPTPVWLACPYEVVLYSDFPPSPSGTGSWWYFFLESPSNTLVTGTGPLQQYTDYTIYMEDSQYGPTVAPSSAASPPPNCTNGYTPPSLSGNSYGDLLSLQNVVYALSPFSSSSATVSTPSQIFTYWSYLTGSTTNTSNTNGTYPQHIGVIGYNIRIQKWADLSGDRHYAGVATTISSQVTMENVALADSFGAGL